MRNPFRAFKPRFIAPYFTVVVIMARNVREVDPLVSSLIPIDLDPVSQHGPLLFNQPLSLSVSPHLDPTHCPQAA
jgi:hypothetical protein